MDRSPTDADLQQHLCQRLAEGAGTPGGDLGQIAETLSLSAESEDRAVARALVQELSSMTRAHVRLDDNGLREQPEEALSTAPPIEGRTSYLLRLSPDTDDRGLDLRHLQEVRTLLAVIQAGTLRQRRAATLRMGELLHDPGALSPEQVREATETLVQLRKIEIAYELSFVCSQLPGAEGRRARAGRREWDQLLAQVAADVQAFWDGELPYEPLSALPSDQQVQLLVRARDLPEEVVYHLCAAVEGSDGRANSENRAALVAALLNAADPRLLPSLRILLEYGETELVSAAARALSRIEDPRVPGILAHAYERALQASQRLALAGALGAVGDMRGHEYVRSALNEEEFPFIPAALQALDTLGTYEDVQRVVLLLERDEPQIVMAAVRTLARIGDRRALVPLSRLWGRTRRSALRAEIEETRGAIMARLELLGEEPPSMEEANEAFDTTKMAAIVQQRDPAWVRLRAVWSLYLGYCFVVVGAHTKAVGRFEQAAALRPTWVKPLLAMALSYARRRNYAAALSTFRRALEIDRDHVEHNPAAARHLAESFLRRADAVELDGRADIAYGLLEEALSFDLRKAPSGLRFALNQRHELLRARTTWS